jgi:hypothetical protein
MFLLSMTLPGRGQKTIIETEIINARDGISGLWLFLPGALCR